MWGGWVNNQPRGGCVVPVPMCVGGGGGFPWMFWTRGAPTVAGRPVGGGFVSISSSLCGVGGGGGGFCWAGGLGGNISLLLWNIIRIWGGGGGGGAGGGFGYAQKHPNMGGVFTLGGPRVFGGGERGGRVGVGTINPTGGGGLVTKITPPHTRGGVCSGLGVFSRGPGGGGVSKS